MLFTVKPFNFRSDFEVVSLYLECNNEILLLHRHTHKAQGGKWGVPAGKVSVNETLRQALQREVYEETGIMPNAAEAKHIDSVFVKHPENHFVYHMYHLSMPGQPGITINQREHQASKWVSPGHALSMNLVDDLETCIKMFYFAKS